jgi:hypothetical protein
MDHRSNEKIMIWHMESVCGIFKNHDSFMLPFAILKFGVELYFQKILVSKWIRMSLKNQELYAFYVLSFENFASDSYLYCIQFCRQTSSLCFLITGLRYFIVSSS